MAKVKIKSDKINPFGGIFFHNLEARCLIYCKTMLYQHKT
jgi:hypothetical protein